MNPKTGQIYELPEGPTLKQKLEEAGLVAVSEKVAADVLLGQRLNDLMDILPDATSEQIAHEARESRQQRRARQRREAKLMRSA